MLCLEKDSPSSNENGYFEPSDTVSQSASHYES
jgi:hypothetical protein